MSEKLDKSLLVYRFSSFGDIAMIIPVLRSFYQIYPDQKIIFVSRDFVKPLFEEFPNLIFKGVDFKLKYRGTKGLFLLYKELKKERIIAIADLHSVIRTFVLNFFFRISFYKVASINKGRRERKKLIRKRNKVFQPLIPMHFRYCEVFRKLGFPLDLNNHEYPNKPLLNNNYLQEMLQANNKIIGIAPFASNEGKTYPLDHMQKVIAYLQKENYVLLFGGGEDNLEQLQIWEKAYSNVRDISNQHNLTEQINIMYYLDVMISMDSANGHIAANCGTPVLSLWGLTHPFCGFKPFDQPIENSLTLDRKNYPEIPTSIFGDRIPKNYESAFRSLDPKTVIEKTLEILDTSRYHHS